MKWFKYVLLSVLIMVCFAIIEMPAFAESGGIETEELTEEEKRRFNERITISFVTEEPKKRPIEYFDVNENGLIAIGCSRFKQKSIAVYTSDGDFQYGYEFNIYGDFALEFKGDSLMIYIVRSDWAVEVDPNGAILSITRRKDTKENRLYWNQLTERTHITVGETEYTIENNIGFLGAFMSKAKLYIKDSNGERMIYDAGRAQFTRLLGVMLIALNALIAFVITLKKIKKSKEAQMKQNIE